MSLNNLSIDMGKSKCQKSIFPFFLNKIVNTKANNTIKRVSQYQGCLVWPPFSFQNYEPTPKLPKEEFLLLMI